MGPDILRALVATAVIFGAAAVYGAAVFYLGFRVGRWTAVAERLLPTVLPAGKQRDEDAETRARRWLTAMRWQQGLHPGTRPDTYAPVTRRMQKEVAERGRAAVRDDFDDEDVAGSDG